MASIDRMISRISDAPVTRYNAGEGTPTTEIHHRGGEKIAVRHPDGTLETANRHTVIHQYDEQDTLIRRYVVGKPPEGYKVLPPDEMPPSLEIYRNIRRQRDDD